MPNAAILNGKRRKIFSPADPTLVHDIINVWLDDEYGLSKVGFEVKSLVDIGANIGVFSLFAHHCFPDAKIHAYEPDAEVLNYTAPNLEHTDVTLFREGVAGAEGCGEMVRSGSSRLNQVTVSAEGGVPLVSLATVVARMGGAIDLLKLDCEGFEWDIFNDARPFAAVRAIRMEYHLVGGKSLGDLRAIAGRLGFAITHLQEDDGFGIAWLDRARAV